MKPRLALRERGLLDEYKVWSTMIRRCHRPDDKSFQWYGARGITVCESWRGSFETFLADMGRRPSGNRPSGRATWTIERNDNNGHYEPANCRWAHFSEQSKTQRQNGGFTTAARAAKAAA